MFAILILCLIFLAIIMALVLWYTYSSFRRRWVALSPVDPSIQIKRFAAGEPVRNDSRKKWPLHGILLEPQGTPENASRKRDFAVIIVHGYLGKKEVFSWLYWSLASNGYRVLAYDQRGHGESKKIGHRTEFHLMAGDLTKIADCACEYWPDMADRLVCIGSSLGAMIGVVVPWQENRFRRKRKKTIRWQMFIGLSLLRDLIHMNENQPWYIRLVFRMSGLNARKSSKMFEGTDFLPSNMFRAVPELRIRLAHAKNDRIVPFSAFEQNAKDLALRSQDYAIYEKGNHVFRGQEASIIGRVFGWLEDLQDKLSN